MARRTIGSSHRFRPHVSGNSTLSLSEAVTGDVSAGADAVNRMPEIIGFRQAGA